MRRILFGAAGGLIIVVLALVLASATRSQGGGSPHGGYLVRAIFDNAGYAVSGEQVRIAGAPVGTIQSLAVTKQNLAAVTFDITDPSFEPWYANATCRIRPQSLIAERYVDCAPGSSSRAPLALIRRGAGAGSHLLPVTQTSTSIDPDIVQDISQEPLRERLSIILDELGTGLAARGADLNAVIRRADPALGQTDRVFQILDKQNRTLAQLAGDSQAVLGPLAVARAKIAGFIRQANVAAVASAQRADDISRSFALLPSFLRQLRPLMVDLQSLAGQGTPLMASLGQSALAIDRQFKELTPFAKAARPALIALGNSAQRSQPELVSAEPLAHRLNRLGTALVPSAKSLDTLTASLKQTGGIQQLMAVLFYGTGATNGFDALGHYVRTEPLVGGCTFYAKTPTQGCSADFGKPAAITASAHETSHERALTGFMHYLMGSGS